MDNPKITSKIVATAVRNLNELANKVRSVTLVWIPAHKGFAGNERADELAKRGSQEVDPTHHYKVGMPAATLKARVRDRIYMEWGEEWRKSSIANHSKSFYGGPNPGKAKFVYKLARLELGRFVRIITGHNNLNFFQNKLGLSRNKDCRFCAGADETITHFLSACPRLQGLRRDTFLDKLPSADMTWSVRGLLHFSFHPGINEAYEGSWASGDPQLSRGPDDGMDTTLDMDLMERRELSRLDGTNDISTPTTA